MGGGKNTKGKPQRGITLIKAWPEFRDNSLDLIFMRAYTVAKGLAERPLRADGPTCHTSLDINEHLTLFVQKFHKSRRYGHGS